MPKNKYTRKQLTDAALICSAMACNRAPIYRGTSEAAADLGVTDEVAPQLAARAFMSVPMPVAETGAMWAILEWSEAASLLLNGDIHLLEG